MTPRYRITAHAKAQCAERGIALAELDEVVARPDITIDADLKDAGVTRGIAHGLVVLVDEARRCIVTVGIDKAARDRWEALAIARKSTVPFKEDTEKEKPRRPRKEVRSAGHRNDEVPAFRAASTHALDKVHPAIREQVTRELAALGLDFRCVRIITPTKVEIVATPLR